MKFLLKLSYLGGGFCGFQVQKNGRTVQGELGTAAEKIFSRRCDISGCRDRKSVGRERVC